MNKISREIREGLLTELGLPQDVTMRHLYEDNYSIDGMEYMILHEHDAMDLVEEYILETLWAFNPSFLSSVTGIDMEIFELLAENGECENNNEIIRRLINSASEVPMDIIVTRAIREDGMGHFLNTYDGEEIEIDTSDGYYKAYRVN